MRIVKVISSLFGNDNLLLTKVLRNGKDDVLESISSTIPGIEFQPLKDDIALHEDSGVMGDDVVIGYIVKKGTTNPEPGEIVIRSRDDGGAEMIFVYVKTDGTIEFGGDAGNLTRYQQLETAFNELKGKHNDLVTAFNTHMHPTAGTGPPSTPTPVPGQIPAQPSTADITGAKIDELKTL